MDVLAFLTAGQHDGQPLADAAPRLGGPAASLGEAIGEADRGDQ